MEGEELHLPLRLAERGGWEKGRTGKKVRARLGYQPETLTEK